MTRFANPPIPNEFASPTLDATPHSSPKMGHVLKPEGRPRRASLGHFRRLFYVVLHCAALKGLKLMAVKIADSLHAIGQELGGAPWQARHN